MRPEPLITVGPELTPDQRRRHARTIAALGEQAQRRLLASRVLVVGAGGLGSPVLTYLAASGVGHLTLVDHDAVEVHNLQRQVIHGTDAVGRPKVDSAADRLRSLNPDVHLDTRQVRLDATNAVDEFTGHDLVVDATDNLAVRFAISDAAHRLDLPVVYGSVSSTRAQVTVFRRSWGIELRDLVEESQAEGVTRLDEVGVLGPLTGIAGSVMATEAVKLLSGVGAPLVGRVLYLDALTAEPQIIPLEVRGG